MKFVYTLIFLITSILSTTALANTSINGRFVLVNHDSLEYTVKFQINTDTGMDTLGCSTIIFNFNDTSLSFPTSPVTNTDYEFLNFNEGNYSSNITRPLLNQIWVNIETLISNQGTAVAQSPAWTDVVQLTFKIQDYTSLPDLTWQTKDNNWAIYDADNITVWNVGTWSNLNASPLPVELTAFSANIVNNDKVKLTWETATETNNFGFDVERASSRPNSITPRQDWVVIGFVKGAGNSSVPLNYSFVDKSVTVGSEYKYRLKQIDYNGNFIYSNVLDVTATLIIKDYSLSQNYPNPFNPSTKIDYSIPRAGRVVLKVFDLLGNEVSTPVNSYKQAGNYSVIFNGSKLASGLYIYELKSGGYISRNKMILLK